MRRVAIASTAAPNSSFLEWHGFGLERFTRSSLSIAAAACSSTPASRFYALEAIDSGEATANPLRRSVDLLLGPWVVPEYLNRSEITIDRTDGRVEVADFDRWAEPLEAGFGNP